MPFVLFAYQYVKTAVHIYFRYTEPDFLFVRSWLPCIFFSGGITMGNIGRQLAVVSTCHYTLFLTRVLVVSQLLFGLFQHILKEVYLIYLTDTGSSSFAPKHHDKKNYCLHYTGFSFGRYIAVFHDFR